jgi:hypothetical protein
MLDTSHIPENLYINISDVQISNIPIKRKAKLGTMIYNMEYKTVSLSWIIEHYSSVDGEYGEHINSFIPDKSKVITADDEVMVNSTTGEFVYKDEFGNYPDVLYCGQYTFFNKLAKHQPLIVADLIRQYGQQANWNV